MAIHRCLSKAALLQRKPATPGPRAAAGAGRQARLAFSGRDACARLAEGRPHADHPFQHPPCRHGLSAGHDSAHMSHDAPHNAPLHREMHHSMLCSSGCMRTQECWRLGRAHSGQALKSAVLQAAQEAQRPGSAAETEHLLSSSMGIAACTVSDRAPASVPASAVDFSAEIEKLQVLPICAYTPMGWPARPILLDSMPCIGLCPHVWVGRRN